MSFVCFSLPAAGLDARLEAGLFGLQMFLLPSPASHFADCFVVAPTDLGVRHLPLHCFAVDEAVKEVLGRLGLEGLLQNLAHLTEMLV